MKTILIILPLLIFSVFSCKESQITFPKDETNDITDYIDEEFKLFWPCPSRAHPNVPLDFRFSFYDQENRPVTWQLTQAPEGMTINESTGQVDWTPTVTDIGEHNVTVQLNIGVETITKTFTTTVNTSDFIFVSLTGNDVTGTGTIDLPYRTIEKAMRSVVNGDGKTIYIRAGTYAEHYIWEAGGVQSPFKSKYFTADKPVEVRSYPSESAILDCELQGHGFWAFQTSYVIFSNIIVINAGADERGGIMLGGDFGMAKDAKVNNSNWSVNNNCTGFKIQGATNAVIDRCSASDNYDRNEPDNWNNSNYLLYTENVTGNIYVINSYSYSSNSGFKIKHAGPAKAIFHNNKSNNDIIAYPLASDYSSIRYCEASNAHTGISIAVTDPNDYNKKTMLIEHNTIVNASSWGISVGYATAIVGNIIRNNIIYNNQDITGLEDGNRLMGFWIYDANAATYPLTIDNNVLYSPNTNGTIIRLGRDEGSQFTFSQWQTSGKDINSVFANPLFTDISNGDYTVPLNSPANFNNGDFAGVYPPK